MPKRIDYVNGYKFPNTFVTFLREIESKRTPAGKLLRMSENLCSFQDCGEVFDCIIGSLTSKKPTKTCGCLFKYAVSLANSENLTGRRFTRLVAIKRVGTDKFANTLWLCMCDCGEETTVSANALLKENTHSCGCYKSDKTSEAHAKDITGQKSGLLTAVRPIGSNAHGNVIWLCNCDCGGTKELTTTRFINERGVSCGCVLNYTQTQIYKFVKNICPSAVSEFRLPNRQQLDICIPFLKLAIEYDGKQHKELWYFDKGDISKLKARKALDRKKNKLLKNMGWKLLRIPSESYRKNPVLWKKKIENFVNQAIQNHAIEVLHV
jgi:very-short-patch-repair endonuclease